MLINGQTTEQVKDMKHIGWGIPVRENKNDWAENFAKSNHLNGTKNSILAKQRMVKFSYNFMKYCTVWKLVMLCEGSAGSEANATKTDQIQSTCTVSETYGASPERIMLRIYSNVWGQQIQRKKYRVTRWTKRRKWTEWRTAGLRRNCWTTNVPT